MQAIIEKSHDGDSRFTSRKPKRAGDDGSPVPDAGGTSLPSWRLKALVGLPGFPTLSGTHMSVCSNRWYNECTFVLFARTGRFFISWKILFL